MNKKNMNSCMNYRFNDAVRTTLKRVVQTARLMVGVGDYQQYLLHMQSNHPYETAMSEVEYFRHCQNSRYPGKDGGIKRCPC